MSSLPRTVFLALAVVVVSSSLALASAKIDPNVMKALRAAPGSSQPVLIRFRDDALASSLRLLRPDGNRVGYVVDTLKSHSRQSQASLRNWLQGNGIASRSYWLGNLLRVEGDATTIQAIAARDDVTAILLDRVWRQSLPAPSADENLLAPNAIEESLGHIGVPLVWEAGVTGEGVVIAGQDTGYQWDHPALKAAYRGWNGLEADHDGNWHDAVHDLIGIGSNDCGVNSAVPCDDHNHGTHTMGTMVGDDGQGNQIGIAPDARWIGCRNMEEGDGTPSTYTECFQWFLAPTDLDGSNADPSRAPHIINNSWGCPLSEGCTPAEVALMKDVVETVRAAGILVVASAGNSGSGCTSVDAPPAIYAASFSVGATSVPGDTIAGFSSRGPTPDGLVKPDVTAPGVGIRSSINGNAYGSSSGTSMAGPHVAGAAALLMSVNPALKHDPQAVEAILRETAVPLTSGQNCGGFDGGQVPNPVFGHGRIDVWAAFRVAETIFAHDFE